jgi:hypothetical protein
MRTVVGLLLLLSAGCDTAVFTLPLPLGGSLIIPFGPISQCKREHEHAHQEQILRMGSSRFLAAIAAEYVDFGDRCGPLEMEAYAREFDCATPMGDGSRWKPENMRGSLGCR